MPVKVFSDLLHVVAAVVDEWRQGRVEREERAHNIAQNLFRGEEKKTKKGKVKRGRAFVLPYCYEVLKDHEKMEKRPDDEETKKDNIDVVVLDDDEEEASSDGAK
ncbi:hypothetical protein D1007_54717 [Hordeum vulgare]|nr:hypothetical protein D1007_54717 [Hordeum vulgare]